VLNGAVYHGAIPGEVEIGHVRLSKSGTTLESACSGWAVNRKVRAHINANPHSLLAGLAAGTNAPEAMLLLPALEQKDKAAQQILGSLADDLAFALSHVVHLFHPQTIIIGGGVSLLGEHLRGPVAEQLPQYVMQAFLPAPLIQIAALRENVVPVGALELAQKIHDTNHNNSL
jgi:glucokinase